MSKAIHRLTVKQLNATEASIALNDGGGLFYRASEKGRGKWAFKFTSPDTEFRALQTQRGNSQFQREMGIGAYPAVTLATARQLATKYRDLVARQIDPIEASRQAAQETKKRAEELTRIALEQAMTFGCYADEHFLPYVLPSFSSDSHIQQWQATFSSDAKALRELPLSTIQREDVLAVLRPIWTTKTVSASRSRQRIERLFAHAIQNGHYKGDNPASWRQFDATLPSPKKEPKHHPAIPHAQIARFMSEVRSRQQRGMSALMLEWIALSACRTGEARFAVWGEIDLERRVWSIPAKRMKMRRDHIVPITVRMSEVLAEAKRRHPAMATTGELKNTDYVFSTEKGKHLSEMAAIMQLRGLEEFKHYTVHGLRATFKGWAATETTFPRELIEEQLAHQLGAVERAYMRQSAFERRRPMMEAWSHQCAGDKPNADNIVLLKSANSEQG